MTAKEKSKDMQIFTKKIQMEIIKMISSLGIGHVGGSLSVADVLSVLYNGEQMKHDPKNPKWEERDWLVCSKGHAGPAVYSALALKGFIPMEQLGTLNRPGTKLPSHCDRNLTVGVDMTTGSLGQGASTAAGVALAHKMNGASNKVFLILGDGEINEGQVWEMALFANAKKLDNLIAFVDSNKLQLDAPTEELIPLGDIAEKFTDFGWHAQSVDGHDVEAIYEAIDEAKKTDSPSMIVLNTVKGCGWNVIENQLSCHSMTISAEQEKEALAEMEQAIKNIEEGR